MQVLFEKTGGVAAFERLIGDLVQADGVAGIMVLGCDANGWESEVLDPILRSVPKPVFGGIFPKIIHGGQAYDQGVVAVGLVSAPDVVMVPGLSDTGADYETALASTSARWVASDADADESLIVFVDGLSKRVAALVEALFFAFGLERNFIGGGAGSLSFQQKPCLITPDGLVADAALVARVKVASSVGVSHGWASISESMKVTEAERNVIHSLDWRPAFEVYRELVERHSGSSFDDHDFFALAKCYPFGISKLGGDMIVRDPLSRDAAEGLVCVGEVPRGSFVHLLNGTPESLIAAACKAKQLADTAASANTPAHGTTFFVDCISRALFLGDRLTDELKAVAGDTTMFGAMTLGEIANSGHDYLEFYNKTAVVARLG